MKKQRRGLNRYSCMTLGKDTKRLWLWDNVSSPIFELHHGKTNAKKGVDDLRGTLSTGKLCPRDLPRNSVVRIIDRLYMTSAADRGC